jgi:hypothetical protein
MARTLRTLLLSVTALGALATAATAAPPTPLPSDVATAGMASMHASGATQMHSGGMTAMHATMTADTAVLAAQGIDVDAMQADCPMLTGDPMASMHGNGGHDPSSHHRPAGR